MIPGNEGADETILPVKSGDVEFLNHVAAELVVVA
jgi:hypothetical protein